MRSVSCVATRCVVVLSMAVGAVSAGAQSNLDYPAFAVIAGGRFGHGFAIRNPDGKPNCVVVTAAHVVRPGDTVQLVGLNTSTQRPARFEAAGRFFEAYPQAELAVIVPTQDLPACRGLRIGDVESVNRRDSLVGRTPFVSPATGDPTWARLVLESNPANSCAFRAGVVGSVLVEPGFSGGLVSFDDQPLGVVQRAESRSVTVSRLDCAPSFVKRYGTPEDAPRPSRAAWDVTGLPEEFRVAFIEAQKQMRRSELAQRVARDIARMAEEAEVRANVTMAGHGRVVDATGLYQGQLDANGMVNGLGVRRVITGETQGDVLLGMWRVEVDGKVAYLAGPGIWRREANAASENHLHSLYEGEQEKGNYSGNGVLTFRSSDIAYTLWKAGQNDAPLTYKRASDGWWFTGRALNGRWTGPGIMWDKDGQIQRVGIWKDGALVDDRTRTLIRP